MIEAVPKPWSWSLLGPLLRQAFTPIPTEPLPVWASKHVFLDRRMTTKPGFYDPEEYLWTWEYQEMIRTREMWLLAHPADGALCIVDPDTPGATKHTVSRITWMKSNVAGVTEGALNGIRYMADNDPQNVIFSIDSRHEAANVNKIRLQPTLQRLGQQIFTDSADDLGKFLLKLRRMLVYFLGSYSSAAFQNKMAEVAIADELEDHGAASGEINTVENLESRLRSAERPLLILISRPKMEGGPIHKEYEKGTKCVYEIPCPHCTAANGGVPAGYQQLLIDQMRFDQCKDLLGEWDFKRVAAETVFQCIHCGKAITEDWKRWFNNRTRRRWRVTNNNPEPGHVSFHISDFYGYHNEVRWGEKLAVKYIQCKRDFEGRQAFRNLHEGLPWEVRATKTSIDDLMLLRGTYKRGTLPWEPTFLLLGGDVGKEYGKGAVLAFKDDTDIAVIDMFECLHPDDFATWLETKEYRCPTSPDTFIIQAGFIDSKYRHEDVYRACLKLPGRLWPTAGNPSHISTSSISFNSLARKGWPRGFGVVAYLDRDAKGELYMESITAWVNYLRELARAKREQRPPALPKPDSARLWFPADIRKDDTGLIEHTNERLVDLDGEAKKHLPHASRQFDWKRTGPNHTGDASKVCLVGKRMLTRGESFPIIDIPPDPE